MNRERHASGCGELGVRMSQFPLLPDLSARRVLLNGSVIVTLLLVSISWFVAAVERGGVGTALEFTVFAVVVIPALTITVVRAGFGTLTIDNAGISAGRGVKGLSRTSYPWNDIVSIRTGSESAFWLSGTSWLMSLAGTPRSSPFVELSLRRESQSRVWPFPSRQRGSPRLQTVRLSTPNPDDILAAAESFLPGAG